MALDVACGLGQNALFVAQRGYGVEALDFSPVAIRRCQREAQRLGLPVQAQVVDLEGYAIAEARYDLILDFFYLDRNLIPSIKRGLKEGGLFLMVTFNVHHRMQRPDFNPAYLLAVGELEQLFGDLEVLWLQDGHNGLSVSSLVGRKAMRGTSLQR